MSVDGKLLAILVCPICKGKLDYKRDAAELWCKAGRSRISDCRWHPSDAGRRGETSHYRREAQLSDFIVVIPARYASSRLPGKPLVDLLGKPMIQRVYEQASLSQASKVVVATDDERIERVVRDFGGEVCMTRADHLSGTDRVFEVADQLKLEDDACVVNVQGDEPLIPPSVIDQVAALLESSDASMATLCESIPTLTELLDPNIVKVVKSSLNQALYFSRAPIPFDRDNLPDEYVGGGFRHIGIYAYQVSLLKKFVTWPESKLK